MTADKLKGNLVMLVTATIFGLNIPITKSLMPEWLTSSDITFLRMSVACCCFWFASLFIPSDKITKRDMVIFMAGGLLGMVLNQMFFIMGLDYTSPIDASIVITITPLLVMLLSAIFLKEPITWMKAGGVLLGGSGALLIILTGAAGISGSRPVLGNTLCVMSSLSYAIYLIMTRSIVQRFHPINLMKWMFLFATIFSTPLAFIHLPDARIFTEAAGISQIGRILYITILATFFTYLLIPVALKRIRPTTVSMYNYVQPLVASVAIILLGQASMTWQKPVAAAMIFAGVYFVTKSKSRADLEKEKMQPLPADDER